jgi:hypothetical protein
LVYGVCGVIGVAIVSVVGLGLYGMNMVDRKFDHVLAAGTGIFRSLPEIRESLPAVLSDALDDRRAPEYRDQMDVRVQVVPGGDGVGVSTLVLEAVNSGPNVVTLLAVRVNLEDGEGRLLRSDTVYIATPFAIEDEWAGPILSGSTRRHAIRVRSWTPGATANIEVCDIRVWEEGRPDTVSAFWGFAG